jgi:DNA-binding CsgD family transcriptional regulator
MHVALVRVLANCKPARQKKAAVTPTLSAREIAILQWLQEGKTNWEIAAIEGRSVLTVKNQVRSILVKLRVNNRAQAVAKAISLKMIRARS